MRQTTIAPPFSVALMTRSFRFLRFRKAVHSSLERLESLVLQLKFSLRISWQHFLIKKSNDANYVSDHEEPHVTLYTDASATGWGCYFQGTPTGGVMELE